MSHHHIGYATGKTFCSSACEEKASINAKIVKKIELSNLNYVENVISLLKTRRVTLHAKRAVKSKFSKLIIIVYVIAVSFLFG